MAADRKVRLFLGTHKGTYVVESDTRRKKWKVHGPFQSGNEVYHVVADPRHPGDVYAAVNNSFFGPMMVRSGDWGAHWKEIPPPMMAVRKERGPPPFGEKPGPIVNLWHIEPGPDSEPDTIYVGVDPASLYKSPDRGKSWTGVDGLNQHETRPKWNPGAGGMCLHSILIDPTDPRRMYVGISAAGTFRSDDAGEHWRPVNHGVTVSFQPERRPEFGQCVHHIALDPADPRIIYRQDHDGMYVSRDRMESWKRIGRALPQDFGFVVATARALPGNAFFVPLYPMSRTAPDGEIQVYRWAEGDRKFHPTIRGRPWPGDQGTHREGLAADGLDPAGIYLGTTTGELFYTPDGTRTWSKIPYGFPPIHSVSVASPTSAR